MPTRKPNDGKTQQQPRGITSDQNPSLAPGLGLLEEFPENLNAYNQEQQDEFIAISSTYYGNVERIRGRRSAWQTHDDLAYSIHLAALRDSDIFVDLDVQLPKDYPKVVAKARVTRIEVFSEAVAAKIQEIVKTFPKKYLGSVVVHVICDEIYALLNDAVSIKVGNRMLPSLEQERKEMQVAVMKEAEERDRERRRREDDAIAEADEMSEEQTKATPQKSLEIRRHGPSEGSLRSPPTPQSASFSTSVAEFPQEMTARDKFTKVDIVFQKVLIGPAMYQQKDKRISIVNPITSVKANPPALALKEIRLSEPRKDTKRFDEDMKNKIEPDLDKTKLYRHRNVVEVFGYTMKRTAISQTQDSDLAAFWEISILSEYFPKGSLREYLAMNGSLSADVVRSYTSQLLEALIFYDQHDYVHPAVHVGNVLLDFSVESGVTLKLSDGYGTQLRNLVTEAKISEVLSPTASTLWSPPELLSDEKKRSKKTCIWDLGTVFVQMALGIEATQATFTSPGDCMEAGNPSDIVLDFLQEVFKSEPNLRLNAFNLKGLEFFRSNETWLFRNRAGSTAPISGRKRGPIGGGRYETDWEELGRLGGGGFGQVYKARNKIDGSLYAIKKVRCATRHDLDTLVTEVQVFSRVRHPYIVHYYGCWNEKDSPESEEEDSETDSRAVQFGLHDPFSATPGDAFGFEYQSLYGGVQFDIDSADNPEGAKPISFGTDEDNNLPEGSDHYPSDRFKYNRPSRSRPESSTLYIQMELCDTRTLKSLLPNMCQDVSENWRIFRQIVEGLEYIHKHSIYHRDLKPDNIFIDDSDNVRIGDFGLATVGPAASGGTEVTPMKASRHTISIGTRGYIAPELRRRGELTYTSKVDMYSLGVIFFEMCYPFPTATERILTLDKIGERNPRLPSRFSEEQWATQGEIILSLLSWDQQLRPSAKDLLANGKIPEPLEETKIKRYLERMVTEDPKGYENILSKYFETEMSRVKDLAWGAGLPVNILNQNPGHMRFMKERFEAVFQRHGAIQTDRQIVFPRYKHYSDAATYLSAEGDVLQLPRDLTLPFARSIAQARPTQSKSYCFGSVYRASGTVPEQIPEVSFDIVSESAMDISLRDAEILKVLDEAIGSVTDLADREIRFYLSHYDLLQYILELCNIKSELYPRVIGVLSLFSSGQVTWPKARSLLRSKEINILETSLNSLVRFNFEEELPKAMERLEGLFEGHVRWGDMSRVLRRLEDITGYASRLGVKAGVFVGPLRISSAQLYPQSLMLQCVDNTDAKLLATGGRYDYLIQSFQKPDVRGSIRASGFRINVNSLIHCVQEDVKKASRSKSGRGTGKESIGSFLPRRCDVIVASTDENLRSSACLDLIQGLWACGISAELADACSSVEEIALAYKSEPHCFIVIVRQDHSVHPGYTVKVRSVVKREEVEKAAQELPSYIKDELEARHGQHNAAHKKTVNTTEYSAYVANRQVIFLTSQHKSKKINRAAVQEAALARRREVAETMDMDCPIVVLETTDDILQSLRNTRITHPSSWRTAIQGAPQQETKYLEGLQEQLEKWHTEGKAGAFIYNHRNRACIYYDLGKSL